MGKVDRAPREAGLAAGFKSAPDVNAPGATGVSPLPSSTSAGRRVTTNDAYLEPRRDLPNLVVRGGVLVVDASVLPTVPRANTNLVAIMLGEVMADRL